MAYVKEDASGKKYLQAKNGKKLYLKDRVPFKPRDISRGEKYV